MRILSMVVFAGVVLASSAAAQTTSPSRILRAYFDAIAIQNWEAAASLLRADDVERLRRDGIAMHRPVAVPPRTAEFFLQRDSTMPRAVAEYQASQFNKRIQTMTDTRGLQMEFAEIKDSAQLLALSVIDVGARWLEARDIRYHMRRMLAASPDCPKEAYSASAASLIPKFDVLGEVVRADSAWVLYRRFETGEDVNEQYTPPPIIATLLRDASGWRIRPREDFSSARYSLAAVTCHAPTRAP